MSLGGIKLAPLLTEIKVDIDSFKGDMSKAASIGKAEADNISKSLAGVTEVGEKLSSVGGKLTKSVSLPLAGIGITAAKMATDFESSFAKVSTLLDDNTTDFDKYKEDLLKASSESKIGVDEFSEAVYGAISAGVEQNKAIDFTTEAMKLAKGGFTDGAAAVDILTTAINGYSLETEDANKISDILITTQNLGKTTVDELAGSMGAVIPVASNVNFEIEELAASYAQLTKNGIDTSVAGTYMKSMLSELGKSGSITDDIFSPENSEISAEDTGRITLNEFKEIESMDTVIDNISEQFEYLIDWDLGDIVSCKNKKWETVIIQKVLEIEEFWDNTGRNITVIFGDQIPSIKKV